MPTWGETRSSVKLDADEKRRFLMKLEVLVVVLLVALMLGFPMAAGTASSITFTSPAAGTSLSGTQTYVISGTISPTPALPDNVVIEVTPQGSHDVLDAQTVRLSDNGTFSYSTNAGGNTAWTAGTYSITARDSYGTIGTISFVYEGPSGSGGPPPISPSGSSSGSSSASPSGNSSVSSYFALGLIPLVALIGVSLAVGNRKAHGRA